MENKTPLFDPHNRPVMECHAHFPGTGPSGEICSRCVLLVPQGSRFVCSKYQRLTGRKPKPISPNSSACKYFERRVRPTASREI